MVSDLRSCTMLSTLPLFYIAQSVNSDDRRTRIQGLRVIMGQDFTLCGSPTITHVGTILQDEINQESGHPQVMLIHSGTNDLTLTTPVDNFISDFSVLITQASTMFP